VVANMIEGQARFVRPDGERPRRIRGLQRTDPGTHPQEPAARGGRWKGRNT